jgi:hypothetical protein
MKRTGRFGGGWRSSQCWEFSSLDFGLVGYSIVPVAVSVIEANWEGQG